MGCTPDLLQSIFDYFNPDHEPGKYGSSDFADAKPKWTTLSKTEQEKRNATAVHKDRLGVVIEIGDHIAHPCGTYGGGSWVDIQEVTKITDNKVNGWSPKRLIVVRTNNANKKLGWQRTLKVVITFAIICVFTLVLAKTVVKLIEKGSGE